VNPSGRDWFVQVWMDPNDFQLPRPFTTSAAVRVDPQIALARKEASYWERQQTPVVANGFAIQQVDDLAGHEEAMGLGHSRHLAGLPPSTRGGTLLLTTASRGSLGCYLNQAGWHSTEPTAVFWFRGIPRTRKRMGKSICKRRLRT